MNLSIASNTNLATRKKHWIDFDAGQLLLVDTSTEACVDEFFQLLLNIASGQRVRNEINQFKEISIWKGGVTLQFYLGNISGYKYALSSGKD